MKKKGLLTLIFICFFLSSVFASEVYLGFGASTARDYLTENGASQLEGVEKYQDAKFIYGIGPRLEIRYYPFNQFRLGFHTSVDLDFVTAIETSGYRSFRYDSILNTTIGLSFLYYINPTLGLFTDVDFSYSWYRFAKNNYPNIKEPGDFVRLQEYGVKGTLGFMTRNNNWYFNFGFTYDYHLSSKPLGVLPLGLMVGGGYIF